MEKQENKYTVNTPGFRRADGFKVTDRASFPISSIDNDRDELYDFLVDMELATADEIGLVTSINGYSLDSLESILFSRTAYRSLKQYKECELGMEFCSKCDKHGDEDTMQKCKPFGEPICDDCIADEKEKKAQDQEFRDHCIDVKNSQKITLTGTFVDRD